MSDQLERFIVAAKQRTYVGDGEPAEASRPGSHDLCYSDGDWHYRDSYFGGTDFLGQETVWNAGQPVWAMNYYGYILRPDLIDAERAGAVIKAALSALYAQGRFLGGFEHHAGAFTYRDKVDGAYQRFHGVEVILRDAVVVYELRYHGGLIKD